jgi:hypothetical protein
MSNINNGLVDGVRRIGAKLRELTIDGGIAGAPLGLRLRGAVQSGPPASGSWRPGDIVTDRAGALWTNTIRGTPGQWAGTSVIIPPSGDQTGIKDTAAINIVVQNQQAALLKTGTYYINNLLLDTYGAIYGTGRGTILQVVSGTTGYAIALKTPATTKQIVLSNFQLNCNQVCGGIQIDNTGFTPDVPFVPYDPLHHLEGLFVIASNGDAFHFDNNARELRVHACVQYFSLGYGFYLGPGAASDGAGCTDSHFTDCTSGASSNHGWYIADTASNNMFTSCKAFYAGFNELTGDWGTTQCGFEILGAYLTFNGCSAQQAALHGFDLNTAIYTTLTGCEADTNSAGASVTTGVGINVNATTLCSVIGCTGDVNESDTPGVQAYGIQTVGTLQSTSIVGNSVSGNSGTLNRTDTGGSQNTFIDPAAVQLNYPFIETQQGMLGLTSAPATAQYFGQLYGWDGSGGGGYAQLATKTGAGLAAMIQMSQYGITSATTPLTNTTTETSLAALTIPADDPVAGAVYRFNVAGIFSTNATAGNDLATINVRWGGVSGTSIMSLVSSTSTLAIAASLSNTPFIIEGEIDFRTATTCVGWLKFTWLNGAATTAATVALTVVSTAVTVTTSSSESLTLDWKWATAETANTVTAETAVIERVA